jgi:hypothetical protein
VTEPEESSSVSRYDDATSYGNDSEDEDEDEDEKLMQENIKNNLSVLQEQLLKKEQEA